MTEKINVTVELKDNITRLTTGCMVCGEPVEILSAKYPYRICDKCKAAILKVRAAMEEE